MDDPLLQAIVAFGLTLILLILLARVAPRLGLIDEPDHRKPHKGRIPLVGGLATYLTLLLLCLFSGWNGESDLGVNGRMIWAFLAAGGLLVLVGVVDDLRGMGVGTRVSFEVVVALVLIEGAGLKLQNLGDLLGLGPILLPAWLAYPFLIICVFGIINAYNMLDGMDGLLSLNVLLTLGAFYLIAELSPGLAGASIAGSLVAFLLSNLKLLPGVPKTFLGDAGSKFLGLTMVSILLSAASSTIGDKAIVPATALYLAGLPLMDMVFVTLRRVAGGRSPFTPERSHVHHLTRALGLGSWGSLAAITGGGMMLPLLGLLLHRSAAPEGLQFGLFLGLFLFYCLVMKWLWGVAERPQVVEPPRGAPPAG